jgi:hypothetical protein
MKRFQIISALALVLALQPARAELLQLDLSIFGMD